MVDWRRLEKDFRDIRDPFSDMRADWSDQPGYRNYWQLAGGIDAFARARFEALARQAGRFLLASNVAIGKCSSDLRAIEDDMARWLTAIREITHRFEFGPIGTLLDANNAPIGNLYTGSINRVIEASALLCLQLSTEERTTPSMKQTIRFEEPSQIGPFRDAIDMIFPYSVVRSDIIGAPEETSSTKRFELKLGISRSLASCWNLQPDKLIKVLFEYGKRYVIQLLKDDTLTSEQELFLTSSSYPTVCPFDPDRIPAPSGATIEVDTGPASLADRIGDEGKIFAKEVIMGDKYEAGQAGAMGPGAHAHDMNFNQVWNQFGNSIDLPLLATELSKLRTELKEKATDADHDITVGSLALAEQAAEKGDGSKTLEYLARAGKWALDAATQIGTSIAAEAIKKSLGM